MYQNKCMCPFTNPCCTDCKLKLHRDKLTFSITQEMSTEFGILHCLHAKQLAELELDLELSLDFEPKSSHRVYIFSIKPTNASKLSLYCDA
jgi:hypothetical protein